MQIKHLLRNLRLLRRLPSRPRATLSSLDAYARWAATYPPHAHNALMEAEQAAMLDLMPPVAGRRILDLASGTGRYGLIAWQRGARLSLALDNSPAMLRANPLPRRVQSTAEALPFSRASIDVILCGLALGHLPDLGASMAEMGRVLRPGGVALVSDVHPFLFLSGAQRTFNADGHTYAVEHHVHLYADYHAAAAHAGLRLEAILEPTLDTPANVPVVIVYRFTKP